MCGPTFCVVGEAQILCFVRLYTRRERLAVFYFHFSAAVMKIPSLHTAVSTAPPVLSTQVTALNSSTLPAAALTQHIAALTSPQPHCSIHTELHTRLSILTVTRMQQATVSATHTKQHNPPS